MAGDMDSQVTWLHLNYWPRIACVELCIQRLELQSDCGDIPPPSERLG